MRIVYMGTGEIGLPSLEWLLTASGHEVVAVFSQPDKTVGRKQILTPPEVKIVAAGHGVPVFQPERLRDNPGALESLSRLKPDLIVVMAYGQILQQAVIEAPEIACVNLHASLLPRHRGASPIQAAIREGDPETGITVMHIVKELDAGDMILKEAIPIMPEDTGGTLHDKLARLGPAALARAIPRLEDGTAARESQNDAEATYAPKLAREDGEIDWSRPAAEIERLIRAHDPWPGTHSWLETDRGRRKLKLYPPVKAGEIDPTGSDRRTDPVGSISVLEGPRLEIVCGAGSHLILGNGGTLQLEGRKRLAVGEFLRGNPVGPGTKLG